MLQLKPYHSSHFDELNAYQLDEIQSGFTASVYENIVNRKIETQSLKYPISIFYQEKPIGFFVLDLSDDKLEFARNQDEILFRSFSLNPEFQGRGFGKKSMMFLEDFIRNKFPEIKKIILGVNFNNPLAIHLYQSIGYTNSGRTLMGRNGLQHILEKNLK